MGRSRAWLVPIEIPTMNAAATMALPLNCDVTLPSLPLRTSPIAVTWNLSIGKSTRGPIGRVQARGGIDPSRVDRSSAPGVSSWGDLMEHLRATDVRAILPGVLPAGRRRAPDLVRLAIYRSPPH